MNIVLLTDHLDRNLQPLCEALYLRMGEHFRLIASSDPDKDCTEQIRQQRGIIREAPYMSGLSHAGTLIDAADAVILCGAPDILAADRLKNDLPVFRCAEKLLDGGVRELFDPLMLYPNWLRHTRWRGKPFYLLCQSARAARDARLLLSYPSKRFKWGVFPRPGSPEIMAARRERAAPGSVPTILWTGELTDPYRPRLAVETAAQLNNDGYDFNLKIIGGGRLESDLSFHIRELKLGSKVTLLGGMSSEAVRINLDQADILMYTADGSIGWGLPVAEGMAGGCAVIACSDCGAARFMIEHEKNGMIYDPDIEDDLVRYTRQLLDDGVLRMSLSEKAYTTACEQWSPETAAARLVTFCRAVSEGEPVPDFKSGPLSRI